MPLTRRGQRQDATNQARYETNTASASLYAVNAYTRLADKLVTYLLSAVPDDPTNKRTIATLAVLAAKRTNNCRLTFHQGHAHSLRGLHSRLVHACLLEQFFHRAARCGKSSNRARGAEDRNPPQFVSRNS